MSETASALENPGVRRALKIGAPVVGILVMMTLLGSVGRDPAPDPLTALGLILTGMGLPLLAVLGVLASAAGYGSVFGAALGQSAFPWTIRLGVGLAVLMLLTLTVGALGLLIAPVPIGILLAGFGLLGWDLRSAPWGNAEVRLSWWWWAAAPSTALLLIAALAPPGWLWDSEYGAYDVLSYHLRLPQEWMASGSMAPVEHNVYSYLPGGVEGLFALLGSATMTPTDSAGAGGGLLAGSGWRVQAAHLLHAFMALLSAWMVHAVVRRMLDLSGVDAGHSARCGAIAGGVFLATPWVTVVGSLAYNEMGVTALAACAMLVAIESRMDTLKRGALTALLVGGACAAKPTAIFMVAPVVGVLLLGSAPMKAWAKLIGIGVAVGLFSLCPWLIRNAMEGGNPVFPQLTGMLGNAHWSGEQVDRYGLAHRFEGGALDRLQTLVWTSPGSSIQSWSAERWRGALNPQFAGVFPVALAIGLLAVLIKSVRRRSLLLLVGLGLQLLAWLTLTHLQSRFLIPCLLTLTVLIGLGAGGLRGRRVRDPAVVACGVLVLAQAVVGMFMFSDQRLSRPNFGLLGGVGMMKGEPYETQVGIADPTAYMNHELPDGSKLLYLGSATPLYNVHEVVYATTWDRSVLASIAQDQPDDIGAWTRALREQGITHAYVDLGEVRRLTLSGWSDPNLPTESLAQWLESLGRPIQTWPFEGETLQLLYRLGE